MAQPSQSAVLDGAIPDMDWTVLPLGTQPFRFSAPSGSLAAIALGDVALDAAGTRVVLVPGATGSKEDFTLLMPLLVAAGYFVESFDLAGQYESSAAGPVAGVRYTYELFVADLIAFLEAGPTPAHVFGHSFAGIVAELALLERPDLFASLTLLGAPPQPGQAFRGVRWIGRLSYLIRPRMIAGLLIWGIVTNRGRADPGRLALLRLRFDYTSRRSVDDIMDLMKHVPDLDSRLADSPVPMLVAVGRNDLWPIPLHESFAVRIGAALEVYPDGGHSIGETVPHQLARDFFTLAGSRAGR